MDLILGVGGSGKTTLGDYIAKNRQYTLCSSELGKLDIRNEFKFYKLFNFNWFWLLISPLTCSPLFLYLSYWYCKKLLSKDIKNFKAQQYTNTLQVSLKSCRVFSFIYAVDSDNNYTSRVTKILQNSGIRLENTIVLTTDNSVHINRIANRGYTIFLYDHLVLFGDNYENLYCNASVEFANCICDRVFIVDTTDFEYSNKMAIDILTKQSV